ncbi:hypothetical protein B0J14DRAFT_644595 [Halenospora varia]|nr:hypothetical protein B0J14DRAFT_644595 [Halenospora varia]
MVLLWLLPPISYEWWLLYLVPAVSFRRWLNSETEEARGPSNSPLSNLESLYASSYMPFYRIGKPLQNHNFILDDMNPTPFRNPRGIAFQLTSIFLFITLFTWLLLYIMFIKTEVSRQHHAEQMMDNLMRTSEATQTQRNMVRDLTQDSRDKEEMEIVLYRCVRMPGWVDEMVEEVVDEVEHGSD